MKQQDVFKKIGGILKELNDQYDYLEAESSQLNELELELFVANAHFLKDHAEILRRLHERNNPQALPITSIQPIEQPEPVILEISKPAPIVDKKPEPIHEQRYFEPVVQQKPAEQKLELASAPVVQLSPPYNPPPAQPEEILTHETAASAPEESQPPAQIDLLSESSSDAYSYERTVPEPIQEELEINHTGWESEDVQKEQTQAFPAATTPELPFTASAIEPAAAINNNSPDVTDDKVLTINQKISALKAEKDKVAATSAPTNVLPITDLKSAINLNDKLLYIKDLFNGYSLAYSEAIEITNRFNSFEEAERFLKTNYVVKNNWDNKPATTEKFYALLRRRYPAG